LVILGGGQCRYWSDGKGRRAGNAVPRLIEARDIGQPTLPNRGCKPKKKGGGRPRRCTDSSAPALSTPKFGRTSRSSLGTDRKREKDMIKDIPDSRPRDDKARESQVIRAKRVRPTRRPTASGDRLLKAKHLNIAHRAQSRLATIPGVGGTDTRRDAERAGLSLR